MGEPANGDHTDSFLEILLPTAKYRLSYQLKCNTCQVIRFDVLPALRMPPRPRTDKAVGFNNNHHSFPAGYNLHLTERRYRMDLLFDEVFNVCP